MTPEMGRLEFRLLGPFEVRTSGVAMNIGGPQLRGVLARLLVDAGRTVSLPALVEELWGQHAPAEAYRTARTYVSRLRTTLRRAVNGNGTSELLIISPPGYSLRVGPEAVDGAQFEQLAISGRQAMAAGQPRLAHERLTAALGLWRGPALAEFDELPAVTGEGARLDRLRLDAIEERNEAALALGCDSELIGELEELVRGHPLRERFWGQLMTALYRCGRQAEALAAFRDARAILVGKHGVEPSPRLAEIHHQILLHDSCLTPGPRLDRPAERRPVSQADAYLTSVEPPTQPQLRGPWPAPAQLPPGVRDFTGRTDELARLDALLSAQAVTCDPVHNGGADALPRPLVIAAVTGSAGVGKTALALHWAHRVAADFADGQLYVNLRGFDPGGSAMDPAEALRGFLDAFGVPAERIPANLQAQAAIYRSLLSGKRVLVVLDNARDVEQVRPLLPGSAGCLGIVTSRNQLTPLVATEGAHPVTLDLLGAVEAQELFVRRVGVERAAAEPDAVDEILARCAGLPLALAVAAARVTVHPDLPLSALATDVRDAASGLDAFHGGDPSTDVRAVFSWSYRTLSADAARLFRLLGLHPGPDVAATAAASLAGLPLARARGLLAELSRAHLLSQHVVGRYVLHDLLRAYAKEQAMREEDEPARHAAVRRMLDHYLHTAHAAALRLKPYAGAITLHTAQAGVSLDQTPDYDTALAWFVAEHQVLLAAIDLAHASGFDRHTWQLAAACTSFLHRANHWGELASVHHLADAAARRSGDRTGQAHALRGLGLADRGLGRLDSARVRARAALELFQETDHALGTARTLENLFWIESALGRYREALDCALQALALFRATGDRAGQATALNNLGWSYTHLGEHREALAWCLQALELQQRLEDRYCQGHTWDSLGYIHHHLGNHDRAVACYQEALQMFRHTGDHYSEATGQMCLGDTHRDAGNLPAAREAWQASLRILTWLNHPDAAKASRRLAGSGSLKSL